MSRRRRIDIPQATYYVVHRGSKYGPVFIQPGDYVLLENLLPAAVRRGASILAYCWMSDAIHLAVQSVNGSVSGFIQRLASCYARRMNARLGGRGHFFADRHRQTLIDADDYLLMLINYIHYIPVLEGAAQAVEDYPHTSHHSYLGLRDVPWLHTDAVRRLIGQGDIGRSGYQQLMTTAPTPTMAELFRKGNPRTPGIVGDAAFASRLPHRVRPYECRMSLDEITTNVALISGVRRDLILSKSRMRECALARAMITWYAIERNVAGLSEVARYLHRDPSTLSRTMNRYRAIRPDLFTLTMFRSLVPIAHGFIRSGRDSPQERLPLHGQGPGFGIPVTIPA